MAYDVGSDSSEEYLIVDDGYGTTLAQMKTVEIVEELDAGEMCRIQRDMNEACKASYMQNVEKYAENLLSIYQDALRAEIMKEIEDDAKELEAGGECKRRRVR